MLKSISILLIALGLSIVFLTAFSDESSDRNQMEQYRQKLQEDVHQLKMDEKKLQADREVLQQDRMQLKRLHESIVREHIEKRKMMQKKMENHPNQTAAPAVPATQ
ncbi:MAG: hypothetical protein SFW66_02290 [Gammaproteobacteria bacterium]|nr:hypothetical protein [Gammaproteobacteria bacterium]